MAYASLLQEQRRALHARIVEATEALAGDRLAEQVERLAHHALRGEVWDTAVTCCQQACARALDHGAFREALTPPFDQALQALTHLPDHSDTRGLAIELRLAVRPSAVRTGRAWAGSRALLGEAKALARAIDQSGPAGASAGRGSGCLRAEREETSTAPLRRASRPSTSRLRSATAPCRYKPPIAWGRHAISSVTSAGRPRSCGGAWRLRTGRLARPVQRPVPVPGMAGADLERARGLRRGPAPRGGSAPPRHAGRPQGTHRSLPTAASATCTSPKGTWSTPSRCWSRAWPSVVPPATGTGCE